MNSLGQKDKSLAECGVISKAFKNVVGQKLQEDFDKTGGLGPGEMAVSSVCNNLNCKMLLHLGLEKWNGDATKQV